MVSIVVFQERNQRSGDRGNLLWRNIHQVYLRRRHNGEVGILTTLNNRTDEGTIIVQRCITLTDNVVLFLFGSQINDIVVVQVGNTILHLTVRSRDKAKLVNLCIDTQ